MPTEILLFGALGLLLVFMIFNTRRRTKQMKAEQEKKRQGTVPGAKVLLQGGLYGTIVSYDLNYRPSLWKAFGGQKKCREVNRRLARLVDVMIGNEEDYTASLGFEVEGVDANLASLEVDKFRNMIKRALAEFPNFKACATTLRGVSTASVNDWSAVCWYRGEFFQAPAMKDVWIMDRVGGGDSFASGLIYGFLTFNDGQKAVNYGCAHGALAMTTPGDTSMASLAEVEKVVAGGSARVVR